MTYKDLSNLIGHHIEMEIPLRDDQKQSGLYRDPDDVEILADYPKNILVRISYGNESYLRFVHKGALYCGDVKLREGLKWLTGKEVIG